MSQQTVFEYLSHGQTPFFRLPGARRDAPEGRFGGTDLVFLGVPFDAGTTYRPGARFGPYHVRRVSALVQSFHPDHRIDVFRHVRAIDGGNSPVSPFDGEAARARIRDDVAEILAARAAPFVVGGDHSVTLPALRAVAAAHGPVAVVQFDAHLDTSGPELWGEAFHHGTPMRHALDEGLIASGQLYQIGVRGAWGSPADPAFGEAHGARPISLQRVAERGVRAVMASVRERIGELPVYVTFDIDAVDPAFAPGTGTPVPGGLTAREALFAVRELAGVALVGMDVVEVAPALDHADATSNLAAYLLFEGAAVLARRLATR